MDESGGFDIGSIVFKSDFIDVRVLLSGALEFYLVFLSPPSFSQLARYDVEVGLLLILLGVFAASSSWLPLLSWS